MVVGKQPTKSQHVFAGAIFTAARTATQWPGSIAGRLTSTGVVRQNLRTDQRRTLRIWSRPLDSSRESQGNLEADDGNQMTR
jgi:hypothetical protein